MQHVENIQYVYLLNKYLKCSVWRLALRYDIYIYIYVVRLQRVKQQSITMRANMNVKLYSCEVYLLET